MPDIGIGHHVFETTDPIRAIAYERLAGTQVMNIFGEGAHAQVWSQEQSRVATMIGYDRWVLHFNMRFTLPKSDIHHIGRYFLKRWAT